METVYKSFSALIDSKGDSHFSKGNKTGTRQLTVVLKNTIKLR